LIERSRLLRATADPPGATWACPATCAALNARPNGPCPGVAFQQKRVGPPFPHGLPTKARIRSRTLSHCVSLTPGGWARPPPLCPCPPPSTESHPGRVAACFSAPCFFELLPNIPALPNYAPTAVSAASPFCLPRPHLSPHPLHHPRSCPDSPSHPCLRTAHGCPAPIAACPAGKSFRKHARPGNRA